MINIYISILPERAEMKDRSRALIYLGNFESVAMVPISFAVAPEGYWCTWFGQKTAGHCIFGTCSVMPGACIGVTISHIGATNPHIGVTKVSLHSLSPLALPWLCS